MRILAFADIHGNVAALDAVLADRHHHGPYDLIICVGDLVWAGPRPREVMARLRELCDDDPTGGSAAVCVQGNTDIFLLGGFRERPPIDKRHKRFMRHREWMLDQLKPADLTFLRQMPFSYRTGPGSGRELLAVHANPHNLNDPIYPDMANQAIDQVIGPPDFDLLVFGHIHIPFVRHWRGSLLANVSAVGLPRDGDPRAAYSVLTWDGVRWGVAQHRVAYNVEAVADDMQACGMPRGKHFARRLLAAKYD